MKKFIADFKAFAMKGNVIDLAVAVIIGGAFGKIVSSAVNDVIMPLIGLVLRKVDVKSLFISLNGEHYADLAAAQAAKAPVLTYGAFLQSVLDFVIVALVIFIVLKRLLALVVKDAPATVTTKDCPECCSAIPLKAKRCPNCTSMIPA
jgi:large conductance mechanosensitive channel